MTLPDVLRLLSLFGLNFLWGWNRTKYSADFDVYGWLTLANGGLALLTAARTNLFAIVLRIPSATLLLYHRWIGRATVIHATIHFAGLIQSYVRTGQFAIVVQTLRIQVGLMAWISLWLIALTSVGFIRRRWFEGFYYAHALFMLFVVGALIHASHAVEFLVPGLALYVIDRLVRFSNNFRRVDVVSAMQYAGDVTKLRTVGLRAHRPAQLAWVQIPGVSLFNWHPFTIASPPSANGEAVFAMRGLGGYTKRVQHLIASAAAEKGEAMGSQPDRAATDSPLDLRIRVDGPYGVGSTEWGYDAVTVVVAGGIGITPGISIAGHIIEKARQAAGSSGARHRHLHVLWIVTSREHVAWFEQELAHLVAVAADPTVPINLSLAIHVTNDDAAAADIEEAGFDLETRPPHQKQDGFLDSQRLIRRGRPDLQAYFGSLRTQHPGLDAAVSACGPARLVAAVRRAAVSEQCRGGSANGAYHIEAETFEL